MIDDPDQNLAEEDVNENESIPPSKRKNKKSRKIDELSKMNTNEKIRNQKSVNKFYVDDDDDDDDGSDMKLMQMKYLASSFDMQDNERLRTYTTTHHSETSSEITTSKTPSTTYVTNYDNTTENYSQNVTSRYGNFLFDFIFLFFQSYITVNGFESGMGKDITSIRL